MTKADQAMTRALAAFGVPTVACPAGNKPEKGEPVESGELAKQWWQHGYRVLCTEGERSLPDGALSQFCWVQTNKAGGHFQAGISGILCFFYLNVIAMALFGLSAFHRHRALRVAVAWSVGLHLLLLISGWLVLPMPLPGFRPYLPATVTVSIPVTEPPVQVADRSTVKRTVSRPESRVLAVPGKTAVAEAGLNSVPRTSADEALRPVRHEQMASGSGRSVSAPGVAVDGDALRQYRLALALSMRQHKSYQQVAIAQSWVGRVEVWIQLPSIGPPVVTLGVGSGQAPLDALALASVKMALQGVAVPDALQGKALRIPLVIDYRPADE